MAVPSFNSWYTAKAGVRTVGPSGKPSMSREQTLAAIFEWEEAKLVKSRSPSKVHDQADCLRIFANQGATLSDAIAYADHILSVAGPVKLLTIHKSKGLEWNHVFILDQELIGDDQQDKNLRYVAITRAKQTLTYINSGEFAGKGDKND